MPSIFFTLDLASGYLHILICPLDTEKLVFAIKSELFEWTTPFPIKIRPSIFNRTLRRILRKYKIDFTSHYFDIIIFFLFFRRKYSTSN